MAVRKQPRAWAIAGKNSLSPALPKQIVTNADVRINYLFSASLSLVIAIERRFRIL
jgi:hypothetical protein